MDSALVPVLLWVLPSVGIGIATGFLVGRAAGAQPAGATLKEERTLMLTSMLALLQSAEQLSTDVDSHQSQLVEAGRMVGDLSVDGELRVAQQDLLRQIQSLMTSNQKLEDDLVCAQYRLEMQARELDRSRAEARTDAVSGVPNRKAFDEAFAYRIADSKRTEQNFSLVLADIDHFKWINDTHGHAAGDRVVAQVARFLQENIRAGDHLARIGGDEFGVLLGSTDSDDAIRTAERIRLLLTRRTFDIGFRGEEGLAVTCSMGLATMRRGETADGLFQRADRALYRAKEGGRNQVAVHRDDPPPETAAETPATAAPTGIKTYPEIAPSELEPAVVG